MKKYLVLKVLVEPALNGGPEKPNIHLQIILILKMTILFQNENWLKKRNMDILYF